MKKLDEKHLNEWLKRWLALPAPSDRIEFPARRGSAPRTVMRGLAGHLFPLIGNVSKLPRPA